MQAELLRWEPVLMPGSEARTSPHPNGNENGPRPLSGFPPMISALLSVMKRSWKAWASLKYRWYKQCRSKICHWSSQVGWKMFSLRQPSSSFNGLYMFTYNYIPTCAFYCWLTPPSIVGSHAKPLLSHGFLQRPQPAVLSGSPWSLCPPGLGMMGIWISSQGELWWIMIISTSQVNPNHPNHPFPSGESTHILLHTSEVPSLRRTQQAVFLVAEKSHFSRRFPWVFLHGMSPKMGVHPQSITIS